MANLFCMLFGHKLALKHPIELRGLPLRWCDVNRYFDGRPQYRQIVVHCARCKEASYADY